MFLAEEGPYEGLRILTDLGNTGSLLQKGWKAVLALIYLSFLPRSRVGHTEVRYEGTKDSLS